jgi:hypothetical protein
LLSENKIKALANHQGFKLGMTSRYLSLSRLVTLSDQKTESKASTKAGDNITASSS